jgi:hypothetical protein
MIAVSTARTTGKQVIGRVRAQFGSIDGWPTIRSVTPGSPATIAVARLRCNSLSRAREAIVSGEIALCSEMRNAATDHIGSSKTLLSCRRVRSQHKRRPLRIRG